MKINLEGPLYWWYNFLISMKIMRIDMIELDPTENDFAVLAFEPRWFWQRKNNGNN